MLIKRRKRIDASMDLTPLIDVVFQLLIFLMVASNFTKPEAHIDLPGSPDPTLTPTLPTDRLTISINPDNTILLNGTEISTQNLATHIREKVATTGITRASIRGDRQSNLGTFVLVMETIRANGIQDISLLKKLHEDPAD